MPESVGRAQVITDRLQEILSEVDLDLTSQRQIINKLAEELGDDVYEYKPLVKAKIKAFLDGMPATVSGEGTAETEAEDAGDIPASQQPVRKRKHEQEQASASKVRRTAEDGEVHFDLSDSRKITVNKFKGKVYVGIREFYSKNGQLTPGKGISLDPSQWSILTEHIRAISQAVSDDNTQHVVKLSDLKQVSVQHWKGRMQVGIREMYEKDNELLPGKKGIALSLEQWEQLCAAASDVSAAVQSFGGGAQETKAKATQQEGPGQKSAQEAGPLAAAPTASSAAPSVPAAEDAFAAASGPSASSALPIHLSASRMADVSPFKGVVYVNIREYYEKDGKQMPGRKGISLPADQFGQLREGHASLTQALEARDESFAIALSGKRKASVSIFNNKPMVNIREYYDKDGEELPGRKGISLPTEQWFKLRDGLDALSAALQSQ